MAAEQALLNTFDEDPQNSLAAAEGLSLKIPSYGTSLK